MLKMQCATSNHAMRHRLATPGLRSPSVADGSIIVCLSEVNYKMTIDLQFCFHERIDKTAQNYFYDCEV